MNMLVLSKTLFQDPDVEDVLETEKLYGHKEVTLSCSDSGQDSVEWFPDGMLNQPEYADFDSIAFFNDGVRLRSLQPPSFEFVCKFIVYHRKDDKVPTRLFPGTKQMTCDKLGNETCLAEGETDFLMGLS